MLKRIVFFLSALMVFFIISNSVHAGTVDLPQTGQARCYDYTGVEIVCAGTGQDGDIRAGVPWPAPRFTDNGNGTVTDNLTGLMWTKDANAPGPTVCAPGTDKTWQEALDYVACLNNNSYLGYADWSLPNVNELESLINEDEPNSAVWLNTQGFSNVQFSNVKFVGVYWSSTTLVNTPITPNNAWSVDMGYGALADNNKITNHYVWPVRSGQSNSQPGQIWKTGQTASYATGDDGDLQRGAPWPALRFTDNGDETVTDNLTELMWPKSTRAGMLFECGLGILDWQEALDYVTCLNNNSYLDYTDWRLPNSKELRSLVDHSNYAPALPTGYPFEDVQSYSFYWSSTTYTNNTGGAQSLYMLVGGVLEYPKKLGIPIYVWPVRSGQVGSSGTNKSGVSLSTTDVVFSDQTVGTESVPQSVALTNSGSADLTIGTLSITGADPADFSIVSDTCSSSTIAPSSSCALDITFTPSSTGTRTANVNIPSNADGSPHSIALSGSGVVTDSDLDGLPDEWEMANFGDLVTSNSTTDSDEDGLLDKDEYVYGTDPNNTDTDGDDLPDSWEIEYGLNPSNLDDASDDNDSDGLTNFQEYAFGTEPYLADTDGDGVDDFNEIALGSNPLVFNETPSIPELSPPAGGDLHPVYSGDGSVLENEIRKDRPTIVLTHGLSMEDQLDDAPDSLWTGYRNTDTGEVDFQKATSLISSQSADVNIIRYVWNGAFTITKGGFDRGGPDRLEYYRAWKHVPSAGAELAKQLIEQLGQDYSQSIHFIGHSLGTAVNAYATNLFLKNAPKVSSAQFTALDRPHHVNDIFQTIFKETDPVFQGLPADEQFFLMSFNQSDLFQERYGYNADFFPALLQDIRPDDSSLELRIDNYYSLDNRVSAGDFFPEAGVGDISNGPVYNHQPDPNNPEGLEEPNDLDDLLFKSEGISNNHSGVHQWYRWTIDPDKLLDRYKNYFTWDIEAAFATTFCDGENLADIGGVSQNFDLSLNPCQKGWYWSLNGSDPDAFPQNIGGARTVRKASLFLESSQELGCYMDSGVIRCREQSSPFLIAEIEIPEGSEFLSFEYRFIDTGDGDYAVVLLDNSPVWTVPGSAFSGEEFVESGPIPISGMSGQHKLTIVLYGVGEKNAELEVQNLSVASVFANSEDSLIEEASEDTTVGAPTGSSGGGGGGCTLSPNAAFDPLLPLFIIWSSLYFVRRRNKIKQKR